METKVCACCGQAFITDPRVNNQTFCSSPQCQKERRRNWRQAKMRTDPAYRENKSRIQRDWLARNPNYWRNYRNKTLTESNPPLSDPSGNDAPISGLYRISFISNAVCAKSDAWIAVITPVCESCPCKVNECKDPT